MAFGLIGLFAGVLLILFGGFMVFLFPTYSESGKATGYQPQSFSISGIFIGLISLAAGFILVFF